MIQKLRLSDTLEGATHAFVWVKPKQDFFKKKTYAHYRT